MSVRREIQMAVRDRVFERWEALRVRNAAYRDGRVTLSEERDAQQAARNPYVRYRDGAHNILRNIRANWIF